MFITQTFVQKHQYDFNKVKYVLKAKLSLYQMFSMDGKYILKVKPSLYQTFSCEGKYVSKVKLSVTKFQHGWEVHLKHKVVPVSIVQLGGKVHLQ